MLGSPSKTARRLALWALAAQISASQTLPEKLIEAGHWKRARSIVESRFQKQPNDPLTNFLLSQIRNAFRDRESPMKFAERAVALDGGTARYHRRLPR
ncbi:MAG TPA: hypothetical protein VNY05_27535 [Candidatus Acidoferrales bacterium]|jgi:hypothetical protein|nr:hypothetical protein [Candidatus Acidoferrales bacterium]